MDRQNLGNPTISEFIRMLTTMKNEYGDIKVCGAYDGNWFTKVEILVFEGTLIIGTIS